MATQATNKLWRFKFKQTEVYVVAPTEQRARKLACADARWTGDTTVIEMNLVSERVVQSKE